MTRKDFLTAAAGVAATLAASKAALAQTQPTPPKQQPTRSEVGSARNLQHVRRRLEQLIDQLQHDKHDYGGYRVKAIASLQQARADLEQALQWDATHPH